MEWVLIEATVPGYGPWPKQMLIHPDEWATTVEDGFGPEGHFPASAKNARVVGRIGIVDNNGLINAQSFSAEY